MVFAKCHEILKPMHEADTQRNQIVFRAESLKKHLKIPNRNNQLGFRNVHVYLRNLNMNNCTTVQNYYFNKFLEATAGNICE
jgi:hypothetical protein